MQKRFFLLLTVVLLVAVLVTGLVAYSEIRRLNDQTNRGYLLAVDRLLEQEMDRGRTAEEASLLALDIYMTQDTSIRITIVNRKGDVLYDNSANPADMENHLFRPEISYALQNRTTASAIRYSSTLKVSMLYVALYAPVQDLVIRTAMPLSSYQAVVSRIVLTMVLVAGLTFILLLLITNLVARRITQPLANLKTAALAMSSGQYQTRVHLMHNRDSEIAAVGNAFNTMAERLETVFHDLKEKNARLDIVFNSMSDPLLVVTADAEVTLLNQRAREVFGRELSEKTEAFPLILLTHSQDTEDLVCRASATGKPAAADLSLRLAGGNADYRVIASPVLTDQPTGVILSFHDISEARRLQKMRSDFVANVTHELRTPLTSIRGFIETLRGGAINQPEKADRFLQIIDIEAERLHQLISDILVLSEIEDLRTEPERVTFDLRAQIDEVAVLLDDAATAAKVSIVVDHPDEPLLVSANPFRIKQVLINLTDNAIKYNMPGGKVFIGAERDSQGKVKLTVRDTGVGIPPEHQERVFERFYRVDKSRSRELGGTGLGLSIVKHIAQLYNGSASVASRPGEGSTFTIILGI